MPKELVYMTQKEIFAHNVIKNLIDGDINGSKVLLIKFHNHINTEVSEITNLNQYGSAFDFLNEEPELYSRTNIKNVMFNRDILKKVNVIK